MKFSLLLILVLLAASVVAYDSDPLGLGDGSTVRFIDGANPACSNSNNGLDSTAPRCNLTSLDTVVASGDTVYIRATTDYVLNSLTFYGKNYADRTLITSYPGERARVGNHHPDYTSTNALWSDVSRGAVNAWVTTISSGYDYTDDFAAITRCDTGEVYFHFEDPGDVYEDYPFLGFHSNDATGNITLRLPTGQNPNNICLYVAGEHAYVFNLQESHNITVANITVQHSAIPFRIKDSKDLVLDGIEIIGGVRRGVYLESANTEGIIIRNSNITYNWNPGWYWNEAKGSIQEGFAIDIDKIAGNVEVDNVTIRGWNNGVIYNSDAFGKNVNVTVKDSTFINMTDDAIEIESYCDKSHFYRNLIYGRNSFGAFSLAPAVGDVCSIHDNIMVMEAILADNTTVIPNKYWEGKCFKTAGSDYSSFNIYHNLCFGGGFVASSSTPSPNDINVTNNIITHHKRTFGASTPTTYHLLQRSGTVADSAFYDYNIWYQYNPAAKFAQYYNSNADNTEYATLADAIAAHPATGWHAGGLWTNPQTNKSVGYPANNYTALEYAPTVDAGYPFTHYVRTTDYYNNPIYGEPDIGAVEYQPTRTTTSELLKAGVPLRLYDDGKFRYKEQGSVGHTINMTVAPGAGWNASRGSYVDINISEYTATSATFTVDPRDYASNVSFILYDMEPDVEFFIIANGSIVKTKNGTTAGSFNFSYGVEDQHIEFSVQQASDPPGNFVFGDSFNRADSAIVGNQWVENETTQATASITSNKLVLADNDRLDGKAQVYHDVEPQTAGTVEIEFTIEINNTEGAAYIELLEGDEAVIIWGIDDEDFISQTWTGVEYYGETIAADTEYTIKLIIDLEEFEYDVYIDNVLKESDRDMGANFIDGVRFRTGGQSIVTAQIDYIQMGDLSDALIIYAYDVYTTNILTNITATFSNGTVANSGDDGTTIVLENWANGNYLVNVTRYGYAPNITNFTHTDITTLSIYMQPDNNINFVFEDEQTNASIKNVTYKLIHTNTSGIYRTKNGTATHKSLAPGWYEVRYGIDSPANETKSYYDERSYFFSIPLSPANLGNVTLRLANASQTNTFVPTVLDKNSRPIKDSYLQALRHFVNENAYLPVEMSKPDSQQGQSVMNLFFNTVPYKFRVYQNNTLLYEDDSYIYLVDNTLTFRVNTDVPLFATNLACNSVQTILTFIDATSTYRWSYSDTYQQFETYCLEVQHRYGLAHLLNTSCTDDPAGIILWTVPVNGSSTAQAYGIDEDGVRCVMDIQEHTYKTSGLSSFGIMGVFLAFIAFMVAVFLSLDNPAIGIILGIATLFGLGTALVGLTIISTVWLSTMLIIGIALIFITRT